MNARPSRVIESSSTTTSRPASSFRFARSIASIPEPAVGVHVHVVARGEHFRGNVPAEVRDLLRSLVDQEGDDVHIRMILLDPHRDLLQEDRLARLRWGDDQTAGPVADRTEEIDEPARGRAASMLERHAGRGIDRREFLERLPRLVRVEIEALDSQDSIDGGSRRSPAGTSAAAGLPRHDLHFELLRGTEREFLEQFSRNEGICIVHDQPVAHLSEAGFGALGNVEDAGETRHESCRLPIFAGRESTVWNPSRDVSAGRLRTSGEGRFGSGGSRHRCRPSLGSMTPPLPPWGSRLLRRLRRAPRWTVVRRGHFQAAGEGVHPQGSLRSTRSEVEQDDPGVVKRIGRSTRRSRSRPRGTRWR